MKTIYLIILSVLLSIFILHFGEIQINAMPPFDAPPQGGLPQCAEDLNECNTDSDTCNAELDECLAQPSQTLPGDGYPNPDVLGVSGHGPELSYTNHGDGTFTDNNSGLMWEIKDMSSGVHDVNNLYQWTSTGINPDGSLFTNFLNKLNNTCRDNEAVNCESNGDDDCTVANGGPGGPCGFAAYRDWCIPHIKQLLTIVDFSTCNGCDGDVAGTSIPPETAGDLYWSSTTNPLFDINAMTVFFGLGSSTGNNKFSTIRARAVRPCL